MSELSRQTVPCRMLLVYDYFDPAFLAGGPISSCANLVRLLENRLEINIVASNMDLDGSRLDVEVDRWIPYGASSILYGEKTWSWRGFYRLLRELKPDVVYLNGIYSFVGVLLPLLLASLHIFRPKLVIAPRGMLQSQSLALKPSKKRLYLRLFRWLTSGPHVRWHVTSEDERTALMRTIPTALDHNIRIIGNVPRTDLVQRSSHVRSATVRFVTIALISPMKGILNVIRALKQVKGSVVYEIYGPVKEPAYWCECLEAAGELPDHVTIKHHCAISRNDIQRALEQSDFYIQPSRSENFGHSILESLMVGVPVITSSTTPWSVIAEKGAGFIVDPDRDDELVDAILRAVEMPQEEYELSCRNARRVAEAYTRDGDFEKRYLELLSGDWDEGSRSLPT